MKGTKLVYVRPSVSGPKWAVDKATWLRAERAVMPHRERYSNPFAVVASVYRKMGGRVFSR